MLISGREAALVLDSAGVTRRQARALLGAGFAGTPLVTSSATLYDESRVEELAAWPGVDLARLAAVCPAEVFVARRMVDVRASTSEQRKALAGDWPIAWTLRLLLRVRIQRHGYVPFVATVCGFVALGADIVDVRADHRGCSIFELGDPGEWFATVHGRRLPTGRGRAWSILDRGRMSAARRSDQRQEPA